MTFKQNETFNQMKKKLNSCEAWIFIARCMKVVKFYCLRKRTESGVLLYKPDYSGLTFLI